MPKFRIEYIDPETEEEVIEYRNFVDGGGVTAEFWAEDYAYTRADKGWHEVHRLPSQVLCRGCLQHKDPDLMENGRCRKCRNAIEKASNRSKASRGKSDRDAKRNYKKGNYPPSFND